MQNIASKIGIKEPLKLYAVKLIPNKEAFSPVTRRSNQDITEEGEEKNNKANTPEVKAERRGLVEQTIGFSLRGWK